MARQVVGDAGPLISADRPYLGVLLMVGFCLLVPLADAGAKVLGATVSLMMLLTTRFALQWIILLPVALSNGNSLRVLRRLFGFIVLRTVLLLPLLVAVSFAAFILATRPIAQRVDPISLQAIGGLVGSAMLFVLWLAGAAMDWPGFAVTMPNRSDGALLFGVGVLGTGAHLLMTWSLRFAPSATLAPIQYLEIPVATLAGWLVFQDIPDRLAAVGIVITILAGLFVLAGERAAQQLETRAPPTGEGQ